MYFRMGFVENIWIDDYKRDSDETVEMGDKCRNGWFRLIDEDREL